MKINEKLIIREFWKFTSEKAFAYNVKFFGDYESDIIQIKGQDAHEFEIKLSVADYMNDFKNKANKHNLYKVAYKGCPNLFSFIMPKDMVNVNMIPTNYGLVEFEVKRIRNGKKVYDILVFSHKKRAKRLSSEPIKPEQLTKFITSLCWKLLK
jgi:hypothetical protein